MPATRRRINTTIREVSASQINEWSESGTPFRASEFWGEEGSSDTGRLEDEWRELYRAHMHAGEIIYTVHSFATPIAWRTTKGWVLVGQTWGPRTARHQSICRGLAPIRNQQGMWCSGSGQTVPAVPKEQRPSYRKGRLGVCPGCDFIRQAPNGAVEHHPTTAKAQR